MGKKSQCLFPEVWGGLECTLNRVGDKYRDQLLYTGHYTRDTDMDQFAALGIKALRYPVLWERHQSRRDGHISWRFATQGLDAARRHGITPIVGLVHHGSGPAFTDLLDKNFAPYLADYARQVARQFPWVEYYTPVNEPLTTARFSGLYGHWYPHHRDNRSFLTMLLHQLKGVVMSMKAIREINPAAKLVQTEDLGKVHSTRLLAYQAAFENERRWLTYDLLCGRVDHLHSLWKYLVAAGIPEADILYFRDNPCPPAIMGLNYYITSERYLDERLERYPAHQHGGNDFQTYADTEMVRAGQPSGVYALLKESWQRYQLPIALTEVHMSCTREEQMRWWYQVWQAACRARADGVDVKAVTAWSLLGSYDWDSLLTEYGYRYDTGVFSVVNNSARPTAVAALIQFVAAQGWYEHPLLHEPAWWQKNSRLLHYTGPTDDVREPGTSPVLVVANDARLGNAYADICAGRGISCVIVSEANKAVTKYHPWAIITAGRHIRLENLHRQSFCYITNDVAELDDSMPAFVHASLDLLIDAETGAWHFDGRRLLPGAGHGHMNHLIEKTLL